MSFDREGGRPPAVDKRPDFPEGHIALPGRAALFDCLYGYGGTSVDEMTAAIDQVTSGMPPDKAARFETTVIRQLESE